MFETGSVVSYGMAGVCRIDGEMQQRVKGEMKSYIVLKPVYKANSTVYVPKDNEKLMSKIKPVLTGGEAEEIISEMSDDNIKWIASDNERTQLFKEILTDGDMKRVAKMVRSLYLHRQSQYEKGRKLHAADEHFFKDAETLLFDGLAHALGIKPEEVCGYINEKLAG
ncbi:MAG: CarD family transcriptional regulator [Ruminococcus sp.]|nr:CarD family transcriptional regulator [Ruminococcus sp.]